MLLLHYKFITTDDIHVFVMSDATSWGRRLLAALPLFVEDF